VKFRIQQYVLLSLRSRWDFQSRCCSPWVYEFTPEGIVRTEDLHQARLVQRATGRILDFIIIRVLFPNEGAPPDEVCFFIFYLIDKAA